MIRICLDKALSEYNISRYELSKRTGIQYQIIDNYYKNKVKRYDGFVLERICNRVYKRLTPCSCREGCYFICKVKPSVW